MIHDVIFILWECPNDLENYYRGSAVHLQESERKIFNRIVKIAQNHGSIRRFINKHSFVSGRNQFSSHRNRPLRSPSGLYIQALSEGLDEVLETYRCKLVELEKTALSNPYLPLSYVLGSVDIFKPLLNTLNRILFSVKERRLYGCQVLHHLQQNALNGNEETTKAISMLIYRLHKIFYDQLCSWLLYGSLKDTAHEFIIQKIERNPTLSPTNTTSRFTSSEHSRASTTITDSLVKFNPNIDYEINGVMLPFYIPASMAKKILFIGKTIALFDSSPMETKNSSIKLLPDMNKSFTIWGDKEPYFHSLINQMKNSKTFNYNQLNTVIDEIKSCVTEHLWVVAVEEAEVLNELQVIKDYFLLGRGELFLELLRLAEPLLNGAPSPISTRDMNQAFNMAARAVLLGNSKDIAKFSFLIPYNKHNASNSDAEFGVLDGWSTVVLEYKVKWPLHLIFTPEVLNLYNEMFRFLLRVKKTQHDLHLVWFIYKKSKRHVSSAWQLHYKLMFLMDHLQHYLQADVLETNYSKLRNEAEKLKDFELLKQAHNTFLSDTLSQAFIPLNLTDEPAPPDGSMDYNHSNPVMDNILEILQLCDAFCTMANETSDPEEEDYHIIGFTARFELLVSKLIQLLAALRMKPCGTHLARLLMRLEFNRWFSGTAHLTQSVTSVL